MTIDQAPHRGQPDRQPSATVAAPRWPRHRRQQRLQRAALLGASCLDDLAVVALTGRGWAKGALVLAGSKGVAVGIAIGIAAGVLWRHIGQRRHRPPHPSPESNAQ